MDKNNVISLHGEDVSYDESGESNKRLISALEDALSRARQGEHCGGVLLFVNKRLHCSYNVVGEFTTSFSVVGALNTVQHVLTGRIQEHIHDS